MKKWVLILCLFSAAALFAQKLHRVPVSPLDIDFGTNGSPLTDLGQIETDGDRIYIRSSQEPRILALTQQGRLLKEIGRPGEAPGEFGAVGVLAMSVSGQRIWAVDAQFERVQLFERGLYQTGFRITAFNQDMAYPSSNRFAFSEGEVVLPAASGGDYLAMVHDYEGRILRYVERPVPKIGMERPSFSGAEDTFWLFYQDRWICLFKYAPSILIFDRNFELEKQFRLGDGFESGYEKIKSFQPNETFAVPHALMTDVEAFGDDLYLMSAGRLNRVSLVDGAIRDVIVFYGEGPDFAEVTAPYLTLFFCRILEHGQLVLGHPGYFWNHDLWTASLPFTTSKF